MESIRKLMSNFNFQFVSLGSHKNLFFGVISYNNITFIALEEFTKECDMA